MTVTLLTLRQAVARALDDIETYVVSSASSSQIATGQIINTSTGVSANRYDRRWIYVNSGAAAGQQRQVVEGSYVASTGALGVTPTWTVTPSNGQTFELTGLFSSTPSTLGAHADYRSLIDRTLDLILSPDRLTKQTSPGLTTISLADQAAWLDREDLIVSYQEPAPVAGYPPVSAAWRGYRFVMDGPSPYLEVRAPFSTNDDLFVNVWRPASSLVNGAESTVGLQADTDTAAVRVSDVVLVGLMLAYEELANRNASRPTGGWAAKHASQLALVTSEHASRAERGDRTLELAAGVALQQQARAA